MLSFGHSLQKDLADKGVRVQTVLPGATATDFWDVAGYAPQKTAEITMRAENLVDAARSGLDAGEQVTIPGLHEGDAWKNWEQARRDLAPTSAMPSRHPGTALSDRRMSPSAQGGMATFD